MTSFNPGDVEIQDLTISSPRNGSWQAAFNCLTVDIFESIFAPTVMATIVIFDDLDNIGRMQIAGDETVSLYIYNPNGESFGYEFHLNSVKNIESKGALKSKQYSIECVSREALTGQSNQVQKAYNDTVDGIVADLHYSYSNSNLPIFTETTKGVRNYVVTSQPSFHAIETLRQEAVSEQNKGSNYMFWQTWRGFYFQSLEYMITQGDVREFTQDNTVGSSLSKSPYNNIINWDVKQSMDATNRIHAGVLNQRVTSYDPHTHKYVSQDFKLGDSDTSSLGASVTASSTFAALFPDAVRTIHRVNNPSATINVGKAYVAAAIPYKQLNLAQMQEQLMNMTVIGDPNLEPGKTVNNVVYKITAETDSMELDSRISGRWLIAKTHHQIQMMDVKPRYICQLECLKGGYEESV
jgi:hypothetical protein